MASVAVIGATGYTGIETVRILAGHPGVSSLRLFGSGRSAGKPWSEVAPYLRDRFDGTVELYEPTAVAGVDVAFLALPHGESGRTAQALSDPAACVGCVIDLSGDMRLDDPALYDQWYGRPAPVPELLGKAAYGMPEFFAEQIRTSRLIANPGCYATAAAIAVTPAMTADAALIGDDVVITATSGASGAGRKAAEHLLAAELHGNLRAYRVGAHQHVPEIRQTVVRAGGREPRLTMVPQIAPWERGILLIATMPVLQGDPATAAAQMVDHYRATYLGCPFVRVSDSRPPELRDVTHTNYCDLFVGHDPTGSRLVVVAALDNLVKGAGGQAVQNWNLVTGVDQTTGLVA